MVSSKRIQIQTRGNCQIVDISGEVSQAVRDSGLKDGTVTVFISGSTAGVTTVEYESGLVSDLQAAFERLAPPEIGYHHARAWGAGHGHGGRRYCKSGTANG